MDVQGYLKEVASIYNTGDATEHSYRSALQSLFSSIDKGVRALNEPKRVKCGAPDFLINRGLIAVGHVEAKDLDKDLSHLKGDDADQKERYLKALPNLIYTNCIDFEFYREGEFLKRISIANFKGGLKPIPGNFAALENHLRDFAAQRLQTITSSERLAEIMAGKAILIKDVLFRVLKEEETFSTELSSQFGAFREQLIHDISPEDFADIYAETIAYGMFAARLHDDTLDTFSRQEALELLPKSNPFLRSLFSYIAGNELDDRIRWIIDDLADVFQATDIRKLLENFGSFTQRNDPFIHFYETFLTKYNPKKRKSRGVWYTPEAVVNFIIRAVNDTLISEFNLPMGLADTSKISVDWDTGQRRLTKRNKLFKSEKNAVEKKEVHRVQILDPATGTGTFLAEIVKQIAPTVKGVAEGLWSSYIEGDLIPRLHGFELLMASYAMCHMKLEMVLGELGYEPTSTPPRLGVYLTNSLEEAEPANQTLPFAQWLSNEVRMANIVKRDMPIMCIVGNPPYSIMSGNLTDEQVALIEPYRSVDGVKIKEKGMLQFEKNINNDYIKFIALSEKLIRNTGSGVFSFITSHGYLKSSSFRGLRQHLMHTFDEIRILDLHGNSEVREIVPDGIIDKNVFDIKQGVSIIVAHRSPNKTQDKQGRVLYAEMWGARQSKYDRLVQSTLDSLSWEECHPRSPNYTFHPSGAKAGTYQVDFFALNVLFPLYSSGVITARDEFAVSESKDILRGRVKEFSGNKGLSDSDLCQRLDISEKKGWDIAKARQRLRSVPDVESILCPISYRPFDNRFVIFDESVVWTTARSTMDNLLRGDNLALISARSEKSGTCSHFFVSKFLVETKCGERTTQSAVFPLYTYPTKEDLVQSRGVNLDAKIFAKLRKLGSDKTKGVPDELSVFDYVYGVMHCPAYRKAYAEFLKIEFPRIPYPASPKEFWDVANKGSILRKLHLMDNVAVGNAPFALKGVGTAEVTDVSFKEGAVWINKKQFFEKVPRPAWDFFIGGYQPAQKWLKDRKSRELSLAEIMHYQKIIKVLAETHRIMGTIYHSAISAS